MATRRVEAQTSLKQVSPARFPLNERGSVPIRDALEFFSG